MLLLKLLPLLIPFFIFVIVLIAKSYIRSLFSPKKEKKDQAMLACDNCETYTHESLLIKKSGKNYCSNKCSNI